MPGTTIIAFEGIDGSGKTVQMYLLESALKNRGLRVESISFPVYDSFFGRHVGQYLTCAEGVSASDVDSKSMALWFALDRFEAFSKLDLSGIDVLLINRYVLSNAVYQSIRERDITDLFDFVLELEHGHFHLPVADIYIYLDVDTQNAGENVVRKGYRGYSGNSRDVYEAQTGIQQRARAKYLEYASVLKNVLVIPCMLGKKQMSKTAIAALIEGELAKTGII